MDYASGLFSDLCIFWKHEHTFLIHELSYAINQLVLLCVKTKLQKGERNE